MNRTVAQHGHHSTGVRRSQNCVASIGVAPVGSAADVGALSYGGHAEAARILLSWPGGVSARYLPSAYTVGNPAILETHPESSSGGERSSVRILQANRKARLFADGHGIRCAIADRSDTERDTAREDPSLRMNTPISRIGIRR